jgi:hypothetical protein
MPDPESSALAPSTEIHPDNVPVWERIQQSSLGPRMKRALGRIAAGQSYREAAKAEGYASHSEIVRAARRYGLQSVTTERLVDRVRRVADMSLEELERRLEADPASFTTKELGITSGIMIDKVSKRERWSVDDVAGGRGSPMLQQIAEKLLRDGGKLELRVSRGEREAGAVIDVEPGK